MGSMGSPRRMAAARRSKRCRGRLVVGRNQRSKSRVRSTVPTTVSRSTMRSPRSRRPRCPRATTTSSKGRMTSMSAGAPRNLEASRRTTCWRRARLKSSAASAAGLPVVIGTAHAYPCCGPGTGWPGRPSKGRAQAGGGRRAGGRPGRRLRQRKERRRLGGLGRAGRGRRRHPWCGGGGGEVAAAEPAGALDPGAVVRSSAQLAGAERSVIRTAELRVEVDDVPGASERALAVVEAAGGFLSGQRSDLSRDANAVLTFKVPPDAFLDALGDLADLGDLVERRVGSDDVTEQVVDLEGRLAATTASVDRLRALLADAADVPQVVAVEGELARREGELESLTGQLRSLRASVDLATVTVTLSPPPGAAGRPGGRHDDPTFADGFRTGGRALAATARA